MGDTEYFEILDDKSVGNVLYYNFHPSIFWLLV